MLVSDMCWCSDMFEICCWNGEKVYVVFSFDCCDCEVIGWVVVNSYFDGLDVCDFIVFSVEVCFGGFKVECLFEWFIDNGLFYVVNEI